MNEIEFKKVFGKQLRYWRKKKGYSQGDLAKKVRIAENSIRNYEKGICLPNAYIINSLCDELDIEPNDLFPSRTYSTRELMNMFDTLGNDEKKLIVEIMRHRRNTF